MLEDADLAFLCDISKSYSEGAGSKVSLIYCYVSLRQAIFTVSLSRILQVKSQQYLESLN